MKKTISFISGSRECTCECNQDYFGDGFTICLQNEPCARHNCSENAQCKISLGGDPTCECVDGYHGDGYHCVKFDPCASCHKFATCKNSHVTNQSKLKGVTLRLTIKS
ncbi:Oidioi.mRNA.OKI2018_I69.PAR.g9140.t1.cds [Oikopleura dioica]|uniref:Oidioi.mRNA.OKI2018_I69.PAR.g9140.t1.cds n=1 Tax=Oikopleura dioica TaxID=34765 RepID=A0ABN7RN82_OIKDI|nr:Oidioi.mRNA.OKI2018_I69.PAR.g9140.t1.cds [Oikopleura dioica]